MADLTYLYSAVTVLVILFTVSLSGIEYVEKFILEKQKERKSNLDKYVSFFLPSTALISFFISCYLVSKILLNGGGKYFGIYFIFVITIIFFILNNTVLHENKVRKYLNGKKFSIVGMLMISGVSALVFGFLDNFGLSLGIEALDHKFLQLFLGPFSVDTRFQPEKKAIGKNLMFVNNWANGNWRSIINQVLRFKEKIRKVPGTGDLMEDIDYFVNRQGGRPLDIPSRIVKENLTHEFVKNIKSKYDTIDDSKAMIGNTFSNIIGGVLGAAIMNMFIYMTKYDGNPTGDEEIDDSVWVKKLNSYLPLLQGLFIGIGCLIPVFLAIAMKRDSHNNNNSKAWAFLLLIFIILLVMLFLSVKGVKSMNSQEKTISLQKILVEMKQRLDISVETEPELNEKMDNLIGSLS
jgi:hypothetical protein